MKTSENVADIFGALAKAQAKIEGAIKGNVNPAFRSRYADLGAVWDAIREPLTTNGVGVLQQLTTGEEGISCTTVLTHSSGQWLEFEPLTVPLAKRDGHGVGSAATYCRRYSLMAAVGLAPIDDDGNAAVGVNPSEPSKMPAPAAAVKAAQQGTETLRAYYAKLARPARDALAAHIETLKATAAQADEQGAAA